MASIKKSHSQEKTTAVKSDSSFKQPKKKLKAAVESGEASRQHKQEVAYAASNYYPVDMAPVETDAKKPAAVQMASNNTKFWVGHHLEQKWKELVPVHKRLSLSLANHLLLTKTRIAQLVTREGLMCTFLKNK